MKRFIRALRCILRRCSLQETFDEAERRRVEAAVAVIRRNAGREVRCCAFDEKGGHGWTIAARGVLTGGFVARGSCLRAFVRILWRDRWAAGAVEEIPVGFVEWPPL